jgi:hypothetical protein
MTKSRWIAVLTGIVAAGLLVMLMLPMPIGSGERIFADSLLIALILLVLLYIRADRGARNERAQKLGGMEKELADSKSFNQSLLDAYVLPFALAAAGAHEEALQALRDRLALGKDFYPARMVSISPLAGDFSCRQDVQAYYAELGLPPLPEPRDCG